MRQLRGRQDNPRRNPQRPTTTSFTRSMVALAVLPRRYYLLPITIEAMYFTILILVIGRESSTS